MSIGVGDPVAAGSTNVMAAILGRQFPGVTLGAALYDPHAGPPPVEGDFREHRD